MVEFEKTCAKLHIRLATLKISSKKQRKSAQEGIYTNLHAEPSILCKARDCNLTLSLSFRKERDVSATPKQGEVKDKALWLRLPKSSISECSKSNVNLVNTT